MTCVQLNVETKGTHHFVRTGCTDQCHHKKPKLPTSLKNSSADDMCSVEC